MGELPQTLHSLLRCHCPHFSNVLITHEQQLLLTYGFAMTIGAQMWQASINEQETCM